MQHKRLNRLLEICRRHCLRNSRVVVGEPYIPFLPDKWNGILVLAEAQNMSTKNQDYVDRVKAMKRDERFQRLGRVEWEGIGIQPWDDGSLPLAVASVFPELAVKQFGVSNAVVWSQRTEEGANKNPSDDLVRRSVRFWSDILAVLKPEQVVTAGKIARGVIEQAWQGSHLALRSPSPRYLSPLVGLFDNEDLFRRFPEVSDALDRQPELLDGHYRANKIFFACHAVSVAKATKQQDSFAN